MKIKKRIHADTGIRRKLNLALLDCMPIWLDAFRRWSPLNGRGGGDLRRVARVALPETRRTPRLKPLFQPQLKAQMERDQKSKERGIIDFPTPETVLAVGATVDGSKPGRRGAILFARFPAPLPQALPASGGGLPGVCRRLGSRDCCFPRTRIFSRA